MVVVLLSVTLLGWGIQQCVLYFYCTVVTVSVQMMAIAWSIVVPRVLTTLLALTHSGGCSNDASRGTAPAEQAACEAAATAAAARGGR